MLAARTYKHCLNVLCLRSPDARSAIGHLRYYRNSLLALRRAVDAWRADARPSDFVMSLGDTIDGLARNESEDALRTVLAEFDRVGVPAHHIIGEKP